MIGYAPFEGDGRMKTGPFGSLALPNTYPVAVTVGQARHLIDAFNKSGQSTHSGSGATLWVLLAWLQTNKIAYRLDAFPGMGYSISRTGVIV